MQALLPFKNFGRLMQGFEFGLPVGPGRVGLPSGYGYVSLEVNSGCRGPCCGRCRCRCRCGSGCRCCGGGGGLLVVGCCWLLLVAAVESCSLLAASGALHFRYRLQEAAQVEWRG